MEIFLPLQIGCMVFSGMHQASPHPAKSSAEVIFSAALRHHRRSAERAEWQFPNHQVLDKRQPQ